MLVIETRRKRLSKWYPKLSVASNESGETGTKISVLSKELGENCSELSVGLMEKPDCLEIVVISYETWSFAVAHTVHASHQGRISDSETAKHILRRSHNYAREVDKKCYTPSRCFRT